MAIAYPYAVEVLADRLKIREVVWGASRNDELSGSGDGRVWQAELADPLWTADVKLAPAMSNEAKQVAALIRKLHGAQEAFFLYDPLSMFPQSDPTGSVLGASNVQVASVPSSSSLTLKGLPDGYTLTLGDKLQIAFSSNPMRYAFLEVCETVSAGSGGVSDTFEVFPHVPAGVGIDDEVVLKRPACLGFIVPGTFKPGTSIGTADHKITDGASFTFMERRR